MSNHQQNYLQKRRLLAKTYLGGVCVVCGTEKDLEFDHVDPQSKEYSISEGIAKHFAWNKLVLELDKCQLLCKVHHWEKTVFDLGWKTDFIQYQCPQCSKAFLRKPRNVNGKLTFCSRSCCAVFYKTNERITQR